METVFLWSDYHIFPGSDGVSSYAIVRVCMCECAYVHAGVCMHVCVNVCMYCIPLGICVCVPNKGESVPDINDERKKDQRDRDVVLAFIPDV